jgi:hypothetical protein
MAEGSGAGNDLEGSARKVGAPRGTIPVTNGGPVARASWQNA